MKQRNKKDYIKISQSILTLVGEKDNILTVNNCITRLRLTLKNKSKINEAELRKIDIVKGINWNGDEFQIIIGSEITRVRDAIDLIYEGKEQAKIRTQNNSVIKKGLSILGGVVSPIIPVLLVCGLLYGLQSILSLTGAINVPTPGQGLGDIDPFSAIVIASSSVGLQVLGVFFAWSIAKYFNGNQTVSLLIALTISSHLLLGGSFGGYVNGRLANDGNGWKLFTIWGQNVYFKSVYGTILPFVGAIAFYLVLDKQLKKIMPLSVDVIFRPFIGFVVTIVVSFFLLSPFLGVIEQVVGVGAAQLLEIPFGMGSGLLALLMQPIVLLGAHLALFAVYSPTLAEGTPTLYVTSVRVAELAQVGALFAVIIRTKDFKVRKEGIGYLFPAFLGITEPVIYGINLQKVRPIIFGCIGACVAGTLAGILRLPSVLGGFGILGFLGFDNVIKMLLFLLADLVGLSVALILTLIFYKERVEEKDVIHKNNKMIIKIAKKHNLDIEKIKRELSYISNEIINNKEAFDDLYSIKMKLLKLENNKEHLILRNSNTDDVEKEMSKLQNEIDSKNKNTLLIKEKIITLYKDKDFINQEIKNEIELELTLM